MSNSDEKHNYNAECQEDEFMVAADFTLYSNPINRALYNRPLQAAVATNTLPPQPQPQTQPAAGTVATSADSQPTTTDDADQSVAKQQQQQQQQPQSAQLESLSSGSVLLGAASVEDYESIPEDEWIASDMTMYDSPLADLERQHLYTAETPKLSLVPATTADVSPASEQAPVSSSDMDDLTSSTATVDTSA